METGKSDIITALRMCSNIGYSVSSVKHEISCLESHVHKLTQLIQENCDHDMIIDRNTFEPCGPTPRICRKCGYTN